MMVIGRLRPDKRSKYGRSKSGRPRAPPRDEARERSRSRQGRGSTSLLEQLPTELLQDIFLFAANLHLPLCSKQLLGALTSEHLKFEITLQILVHQKDKLDHEDKSLLLSRRFFTWDFLVRYVRFTHSRIIAAGDEDSSSEDEDEDDGYATERSFSTNTSRAKKSITPIPKLQEFDARLTSLTRNAVDELRRDDVSHLLQVDTASSPALEELQQTKSLQGLQDLDLPEKLLHNSWDDDRQRLLRLLIAFNCTVSRLSAAGAAAERGILEVIEQGDEEMVSYFLGVHIGADPTIDMLRQAIMGSNVSIVFQLLRSGHGELDSLDPQVWSLLEEHMQWKKRTKAMVKKWLQKGIREPLIEEDMRYLPRLRDIEVDASRWQKEG
jgi:hypothetical protein